MALFDISVDVPNTEKSGFGWHCKVECNKHGQFVVGMFWNDKPFPTHTFEVPVETIEKLLQAYQNGI